MNKNKVKSVLAFWCLWLAASPLSAQSSTKGEGYDYDGKAIVAILPFTGEDEAVAAFDQAVTEAVANLQKYSPRKLSSAAVEAAGVKIPTDMPPIRELVPGARYAITGGVYPGNNENQYYLQLWLWDMINSTMIYTDDLVYQNIDEGLVSLPGLVEWLFSHIIEVPVESEAPPEEAQEEKPFSFGLRSGLSRRWYINPEENASGADALVYEGGIFVSVFLNHLLSVQGEMSFTFDNLVYRGISDTIPGIGYEPVLANEKFTSFSLLFPFILKANFRPGNFRAAPFAGLYLFAPLGEASYRMSLAGEDLSFSQSVTAPLGYILGFEAARPWGPGMLLADMRYAEDFGDTTIKNGEDLVYRRRSLSVTLGYAFDFNPFKKK
jgi:hypothetical protein